MNLILSILNELSDQGVTIESERVKMHAVGSASEFPSCDEAVSFLKGKIKKNRSLLAEIWRSVSTYTPDEIGISNENIEKIFISALKHLTRISSMDKYLVKNKIHENICRLLLLDSLSFSQEDMKSIIEYRMSIDWLICLIQSDIYKCRLLLWTKWVKVDKIPKEAAIAAPYGRNLDYSKGERSQPFWRVEESLYDLYNVQTGDPTGLPRALTTERSSWEKSHDMRHESENDWDDPKIGNRFFMDHANDGWLWENRFTDGPPSSLNTHVRR